MIENKIKRHPSLDPDLDCARPGPIIMHSQIVIYLNILDEAEPWGTEMLHDSEPWGTEMLHDGMTMQGGAPSTT